MTNQHESSIDNRVRHRDAGDAFEHAQRRCELIVDRMKAVFNEGGADWKDTFAALQLKLELAINATDRVYCFLVP